jgi:hypothetical protein
MKRSNCTFSIRANGDLQNQTRISKEYHRQKLFLQRILELCVQNTFCF